MRLYETERIRRLLRALPRGGPLAWLEIVLLVGLGIVLANLAWTILTPVGPLGNWRPRQAMVLPADARRALFARFDPFYRTSDQPAAAQAVTALSLGLFGVRINEATGLGSAIIATPDGIQSSFVVGDEIVPGVTLKAVAIDHVVLDKGGADELLYLDQSESAPVARPTAAPGLDLSGLATPAAAPTRTPQNAATAPASAAPTTMPTAPPGATINFAPQHNEAAPTNANSATPNR